MNIHGYQSAWDSVTTAEWAEDPPDGRAGGRGGAETCRGEGAGRAGGGGCQPTTPPPPLFPNHTGHSSPIGTIWLIPPGKEVPERGLSVLFSPTRYALWKAVKMSGVSDPNNRRHNLSGFLFRPRRRVVRSCVILLRFLPHA